ncbi:MAG TPA: ParB/RepB/Spo0J family partition protein [Chloroflexota bacterium]|nr:ParB/RepB/Spo0J family partition protein [Chloroflexota bacterium]
MPPRRGGLGRGLDALFGQPSTTTSGRPPADASDHSLPTVDAETQAARERGGTLGEPPSSAERGSCSALLEVEIGRIGPNPRQPRREMDPDQLEELAASIREHGVLQPLVVTRLEAGNGRPRYQLIAGERRLQAAKLAGLVRVPVIVREAAGRELLELALIENVQRADLNAIEEAIAYQQLAEEFGLTQEEIGQRVGKSRFAVANTMRLLGLPAAVQQALLDGQLTEGHARAILQAGDREAQRRLAGDVVQRGLSVRQTEELARRAQQAGHLEQAGPSTARARRHPAADDVEEIEERFREALGTKVQLTRGRKGGRLVIHYFDDEQLQSIYDRLTAE